MLLWPIFTERVRQMVAAVNKRGHKIEVTQGLRTFAEQGALYAQGRTRKGPVVTNAKAGQSLHNYGVAVDFALILNGKYVWPERHPVWRIIGEEARKVGLEAGYWWKNQDKPHVELPGITWQELSKWHRKGGIDEVWKQLRKTFEYFKSTSAVPLAGARALVSGETD